MARAGFPDICAEGCYMPHVCRGTAAACRMRPKAYYPIFADLHGRRCVVVGGGLIAQRKVTTLLRYGTQITVITPAATARLRWYARQHRIRLFARRFRAGDLRGAWLVYGATDDPAINRAVCREAHRRGIFANIVDQTPLCSFIAPSILQRGALTIAVSTGGASPSLAKRLRHELGGAISSDYGRMLRLLRGLRGVAKRRLPQYQDRKRYFDRLVRGRVFDLVRQGHLPAARREALRRLDGAAQQTTGTGPLRGPVPFKVKHLSRPGPLRGPVPFKASYLT